MAKTQGKKSKSILTDNSFTFLKKYINNASPVGFETSGQKLWLEYIKPYVDTHFTDPYGTAVGVLNPNAPFKVVIEGNNKKSIDPFFIKISDHAAYPISFVIFPVTKIKKNANGINKKELANAKEYFLFPDNILFY